MIERINELFARHGGGAGATRGSLVRIHVWVLVTLAVASSLAPSHGVNALARGFGPVQNLRLNITDQRAFAPSGYGKRFFHVAWIFGSEGDVMNEPAGVTPGTIGTYLAKTLPEIGNKRVVVDTYDISSMKLGDLYLTLLDALAAKPKPDLVMLSLNPVWVMNPVALQRWPHLNARAALEIAKRPSQWGLGAALLSPSDLLWGLTESQLKPFQERLYWSNRVHRLVDDVGPLDRSQLRSPSAAVRPDRSQIVLGQQAITFWAAYRLHLIPHRAFGTLRQVPVGPDQWARWVNLSNHGDNQLNAALLRAIGADLRASGIPSVVYLAQANRVWLASNPAFAHAVAGVEQQLEGFRGTFDARNVLYQPRALSHFVTDLVYKDETHISGVGTIGPYFASQVCRVLAQVGRGAGCTPVNEGSKP
jgi:hypothetical protein